MRTKTIHIAKPFLACFRREDAGEKRQKFLYEALKRNLASEGIIIFSERYSWSDITWAIWENKDVLEFGQLGETVRGYSVFYNCVLFDIANFKRAIKLFKKSKYEKSGTY